MFLFRSNMYPLHTIHILDFSTWSYFLDNDNYNEIQSDNARVETRSHQRNGIRNCQQMHHVMGRRRRSRLACRQTLVPPHDARGRNLRTMDPILQPHSIQGQTISHVVGGRRRGNRGGTKKRPRDTGTRHDESPIHVPRHSQSR